MTTSLTTPPSLLAYVAGINKTVSKNIITYREENGKFNTRKELLKVPKLGAKAFEQCAGFLRITDGDNVLDNTSVHPESYKAAAQLLKHMGYTEQDVQDGTVADLKQRLSKENTHKLAEELGIGEITLKDIADSIIKKGRDPREELPQPVLRSDILSMEDLKPDMVLTGTVRNVIDFGAFVDIGVHQDGLVHISQMSAERRIEHPLDIVSVGDIVDVRVIDVDTNKGRISLSMILDEKEAANRSYKNNSDKNGDKKNNKNNGSRNNKNNAGRKSSKQQGLNLRGLEKFMH